MFQQVPSLQCMQARSNKSANHRAYQTTCSLHLQLSQAPLCLQYSVLEPSRCVARIKTTKLFMHALDRFT
jgi:hypothetical protein